MKREIWKGCEAIAEAAIRAGCKAYFGYPITPQNELPEYMSSHMPAAGGVFVQSESELAAINMVYGAAATGVRAMTSSSSPGVSLKQEGISYMAAVELPGVIVNVMRGGPGLGSIQPSQCDYYQATRGGGNGDYRTLTLAPLNIQEAVDLMFDAFDLADLYRNPVMILADGLIGQMMEPIVWKEHPKRELPNKAWAASGRKGRGHNNFLTSLLIKAEDCEAHNLHLAEKYKAMEEKECRWEEIALDDAELIFVAYGTPARIAISAIENLRKQGIKAGMIRPITLWPFPKAPLRKAADQVKRFVCVELNMGQMREDVQLAVECKKPVDLCFRVGGMIPSPDEVLDAIRKANEGGND